MHFYSIRKYKITVSPFKALQNVVETYIDMYSLQLHLKKRTKLLNLYMNKTKSYKLAQQVKSTSFYVICIYYLM